MKKYSQREKLIEFQGRNENSNNKKNLRQIQGIILY